ncbi:MAG: hypothetical protein AMJ46_10005 [Latescibacteria bacterium DG_63]|nr:MAG: hypothetical protein AMJ46_10005 [Latescibacteria bacterium DG_63]
MGEHLADGQDGRQPQGVGAAWPWLTTGTSAEPEEGFTKFPNYILEKILIFGFSKCELLIVLAVVRKTCGWHKEMDSLSYSQIVKLTGIARRHVRKVTKRLREACVLTCEGDPGGRDPLNWGIERRTELWDHELLCKLRDRGETKKPRFPSLEAEREGITVIPSEGIDSVHGGGDRIGAPQKKALKKAIKKTGAADAAVSSSQTGETREGGLEESSNPPSAGQRSSCVGANTPNKEQRIRLVNLCAELESAGHNPYLWLARKRKEGVPIPAVIEVLEDVAKHKELVREFWGRAESRLGQIRERELGAHIEGEHEQRKAAFAHSAGDILEQVALRALRKQEDGEERSRDD